jgi:thymidine phosphorylase
MDRPLGSAVGNALEIAESIDALRGGGPGDLREVTLALAAEMLVLGDTAPDLDAGRTMAAAALDDGRAYDCFRRIVEAQQGDVSAIDDPGRLPQAPVRRDVTADRAGVVAGMDVRAIGLAAVGLGAGRSSLGARIDPAVGFLVPVKPGQRIERGDPVATIHARDDASAETAAAELIAAITIGEEPAVPLPLVGARIDAP